MTENEQAQLERFRRGEPGAFDALYAEYGPRLYRFGLRLCGREADAEDLTQEVFVATFHSLHRFEGRSSLATYLYKIAVYRWHRIQACRRLDTVAWDESRAARTRAEAQSVSDPARIGQERMELSEALASLSPARRAALLLVKVEGLSCREAAEVLEIPVGTVKYQVYEAILHLKARLDPSCQISPSYSTAIPSSKVGAKGGTTDAL